MDPKKHMRNRNVKVKVHPNKFGKSGPDRPMGPPGGVSVTEDPSPTLMDAISPPYTA
jgi:hypothetical protein